MLCELACTDCSSSFSSASCLLQHFAEHASTEKLSASREGSTLKNTKGNGVIKTELNQNTMSQTSLDLLPSTGYDNDDDNIDSGIEDVNPLQYCTVTLNTDNQVVQRKKYNCTFCFKSFGWSTDLKRHTLIHTGERPFQCTLCDSSFTRKFLLQKHFARLHNKTCSSNKNNIQSHQSVPQKQSRKQAKQSIKHNT